MVKKRKTNSIAKQPVMVDIESSASDFAQSNDCDIPTKKANGACFLETNSKAPPTKTKSKQKKKRMVRVDTAWEEENVEQSTFSIDQCRNPLEQEEHWELRRAFLEKNQHVLPPEELVCLAQVYINVQMLGCRYPPETMEMVNKLSEGVGREYHRSRAFMLKRTFVSATDAAASKVRREGPVFASNVATNPAGQAVDASESAIPSYLLDCLRNDLIIFNNDFRLTIQTFNELNNGTKIEANFRPRGQGMYEGFVEASGITIATALVNDGKRALKMAMENAMKIFSQYCYSLTRKKRATELDGIEVIPKSDTGEQNDTDHDKLDTGNIGFKLLAKLGWKGGSLGARGDGIVNPVTVDQKIGRKGLGHNAPAQGKLNRAMIKEKLMDLRDGRIEDHHIVFSNEYSKEDRKHIHLLAKSMNLKSQSYGKDNDGTRQLVVSRKGLRPRELIRKVILEKDPTFCEMYEVTPPAEQA